MRKQIISVQITFWHWHWVLNHRPLDYKAGHWIFCSRPWQLWNTWRMLFCCITSENLEFKCDFKKYFPSICNPWLCGSTAVKTWYQSRNNSICRNVRSGFTSMSFPLSFETTKVTVSYLNHLIRHDLKLSLFWYWRILFALNT